MFRVCIVIVMLGVLAGCAGELADARGVTYGDALSYIRENHQARVDYRAKKEVVIAAQYNAYLTAATLAWSEDEFEKAEAMWDKALALLEENYRDLATIEALRKGIDDFGEFRRQVEDRNR